MSRAGGWLAGAQETEESFYNPATAIRFCWDLRQYTRSTPYFKLLYLLRNSFLTVNKDSFPGIYLPSIYPSQKRTCFLVHPSQ